MIAKKIFEKLVYKIFNKYISAEKMFEKIGYHEDINYYSDYVIKVYRKDAQFMYFNNDKTINLVDKTLNIDLLQAINKQVEELGWNK